MITDFSGVGYDFAFGYEKPVVVMDSPIDYSIFEGRFLDTALWPEGVRYSVGIMVDSGNIDRLPEIIERAMTQDADAARKKRDEYLANFGCASEAAKGQLLELLAETK